MGRADEPRDMIDMIEHVMKAGVLGLYGSRQRTDADHAAFRRKRQDCVVPPIAVGRFNAVTVRVGANRSPRARNCLKGSLVSAVAHVQQHRNFIYSVDQFLSEQCKATIPVLGARIAIQVCEAAMQPEASQS